MDPQSLDYDYGTKVILSAKEVDGFLFKFWNDDKEDTSPNKDFIIKNDTTVVANFARVSNVEKLNEGIPAKFYLMQNYPNPFNAQAIIRYGVAKDSNVKISIFNLQGQKLVTLVNDYHKAGAYVIDWDCSHHAGESFTSGICVYLMEAQNHHKEIKKMTIIR
jgi:hypothetical protein